MAVVTKNVITQIFQSLYNFISTLVMEKEVDTEAAELAKDPQRMQRIMRRNRMIQKIKDQQSVMMNLQEQLDNYMHRSFPSLG